jgi:hypothetical protein
MTTHDKEDQVYKKHNFNVLSKSTYATSLKYSLILSETTPKANKSSPQISIKCTLPKSQQTPPFPLISALSYYEAFLFKYPCNGSTLTLLDNPTRYIGLLGDFARILAIPLLLVGDDIAVVCPTTAVGNFTSVLVI